MNIGSLEIYRRIGKPANLDAVMLGIQSYDCASRADIEPLATIFRDAHVACRRHLVIHNIIEEIEVNSEIGMDGLIGI